MSCFFEFPNEELLLEVGSAAHAVRVHRRTVINLDKILSIYWKIETSTAYGPEKKLICMVMLPDRNFEVRDKENFRALKTAMRNLHDMSNVTVPPEPQEVH